MPTSFENQNITWAIREFTKTDPKTGMSRAKLYQLYRDYYEGRHKLTFATEKFRTTFGDTFQAMSENLCPICVDTLADLMQIQGFVPTKGGKRQAKLIATETQEIERRSRMKSRRGAIYRDAFIYGDNYVLVWPHRNDERQPVIYPNVPGSIVCEYDEEEIGLIIRAAKFWKTRDGKGRLNLYFPDRIEKYITINKVNGIPPTPAAFTYHNEDERWPLYHPFERVPIFHYSNNAGVGENGNSELRDIIEPQNGLNKALCDMLVAMEFEAFAQRWVTGLEPQIDPETGLVIPPFKAGIDRVWNATKADAKFGEFSRADLKDFIEVQNSLRSSIARVAGFPLHFFMIGTGTPPSGESLRVASTRLTSKAKDRQISFGDVEEDMMRFCLRIRGFTKIEVAALWNDPAPELTLQELWATANNQAEFTGDKQVLRERGYSEEQIEQFEDERFEREQSDGFPRARQPGLDDPENDDPNSDE
jgi:hypothetical protein